MNADEAQSIQSTIYPKTAERNKLACGRPGEKDVWLMENGLSWLYAKGLVADSAERTCSDWIFIFSFVIWNFLINFQV